VSSLVERTGIEPVTSGLQSWVHGVPTRHWTPGIRFVEPNPGFGVACRYPLLRGSMLPKVLPIAGAAQPMTPAHWPIPASAS
jgi:hypothetical protein